MRLEILKNQLIIYIYLYKKYLKKIYILDLINYLNLI